MCTLVVYHQQRDDLPTVIAANRDEFLARPAAPPSLDTTGPVPIVAGRDLQAQGSWLGATTTGFFVGLTNQRAPPSTERLASRGAVVMNMLRAGSFAAARDLLAGLDPTQYRGFNLLFGDGAQLAAAYVRPEPATLTIEPLGPGVHVLANETLGSPRFPKTARPTQIVPASVLRTLPWPAVSRRLEAMLADHTLPPAEDLPPPDPWMPAALSDRLQALCIHLPLYGTVSSAVIALRPGALVHYRHAEGHPCVTPFVDHWPGA